MSNPYVVVENGVIECAHGGQVVLKSSVPNLVIGGKKPLYNIDLLEAPIKDCPKDSPCTKVTAISTATTELNVAGAGTNFLLRVDGCQTNKGAALKLVDPGQANHRIMKKSSGPASQLYTEVLAIDPKEAAVPEPNETCRFHPLRQDGELFKPLRGFRRFEVHKDYHYAVDDTVTFDKVVTGTGGFLYVTFENVITEYRVINRGEFCTPTIGEVFFQETETRKIRTGIPFFKNEGTVEFVYSDLRLNKKDLGFFASTVVAVSPSEKQCLNDYSEIGAFTDVAGKRLSKEHLITGDEAREASDKPVAVVVGLIDPVGEVQDRYYEYEYSFKKHYAHNQPVFSALRNANRYPYAVAQMTDYLYVSEEEQEAYDTRRKEMLKQYHILANGVCRDLAKDVVAMIDTTKTYNSDHSCDLAPAIDLSVARQFMDETKFIVPSFFEASDPDFFIGGDDYDDAHFYLNGGNVVWLYAQTRDRRRFGRSAGLFGRRNLGLFGSQFTDVAKRPGEVLALLVFTFCYGKQHESLIAAHPELKEAAESFYFLLKTAIPQPQINDDAIKEVRDEIVYQSALEPIFSDTLPLLGEYEQLETLHRKFAFDPDGVKKLRAEKHYSFKALKASEEMPAVYRDEEIRSPAAIAKEAASLLGRDALAARLGSYKQVDPFGADPTGFYYCRTLMNVAAMLMDPEQPLDDKTRLISPFNTANSAVAELCQHIGETQLTLDEATALKLHDEPVKGYYLDALYMYVAHAYTEKPAADFPGAPKGSWFELLVGTGSNDDGRRTNVIAFMDAFAEEGAKPAPQFEKLLDNNFDKGLKLKTESEKVYECLKKINGVSSYIGKADEVMGDLGGDASKGMQKKFIDLQSSKPYQKLLVSSKALAFFMAAANIAEFVQGRKRLDLPNLTGFVGDVLSVSRQMGELIPKALQAASPEAKAAAKMAKSLPESVEHLFKVDRIASPAHMKVLTRFGLVGVMAGAVNDVAAMDFENNRDYAIAVSVKNGIYLALLLVPGVGWAGAAGLAAVATLELVWYFASNRIQNSSLELYLYRSLLFNAKEHNDGRWFNTLEHDAQRPYSAGILLDTLKSSGGDYLLDKKPTPASQLTGFMTLDGLRTFVAANYGAHPHAFEAAMENELALLKTSLYGYKLDSETSERNLRLRNAYGMEFGVLSRDKVQLDKNLFDDAQSVWLARNGAYEELGKMRDYDIIPHVISQSDLFETRAAEYLKTLAPATAMGVMKKDALVLDMLKGLCLIVVCNEVVVKFAVECAAKDLGNAEVWITGFKVEGMTEEDYKHVKKA